MNLEPAMQQMFSNLGATTLYRVVSVLQAPFVMKDENGKRIRGGGALGCLFHLSPKFYIYVVICVGLTSFGIFINSVQRFCVSSLGMYINLSAI